LQAPLWLERARQLFFVSPDRQMMSVAANHGAGMEFGAPAFPDYDVTPDGQRFVVVIRDAATAPLQVAVNWQSGLR
jgi:hypothetical protein